MAGRPPSPLRQSVGSREIGVVVSDTDVRRVTALARWYCLSTDHLVRLENPLEMWHPQHTGGDLPPEYANAKLGVRRRLSRLGRIQEAPAAHVGPLVKPALVHVGQTGWHATPYGVTTAGLPWRVKATINPAFVGHAWLAADVGGQVERWAATNGHGLTVLSEREVSTGVLANGDQVDIPLESSFVTAAGGVRAKRPDVVLLATDRESYIAVEVERQKNKPRREYEAKLAAYRDNPLVSAVWYVCTTPAIRDRVATAANEVLSADYPLRIRPTVDRGGWFEIEDLDTHANMLSDLERIR